MSWTPEFHYDVFDPGSGGGGTPFPVTVSPPAAVDPPGPSTDGDLYYNTVLSEWMGYDGGRGKWLSLAAYTILAGRNQNTAAGTYLQGIGSTGMASDQGWPVDKGTVVYVGLEKTDTNASDLETYVGGGVVHTLALAASAGAHEDGAANADFAAGIMALRNKTTGATITNAQARLVYKKRV